MITLGDPLKTLFVQSQSRSRVSVEVSEVKKAIIKRDNITNRNSEKISMEHAELKFGHTTRFLPRQTEALMDSDKNTHMGNSRLGGNRRFSSRQVSESSYITHEVSQELYLLQRTNSDPHLITPKTFVKVQTSR